MNSKSSKKEHFKKVGNEKQKKELYVLLDVEESATVGEITKAYRLQALKYHPDRNANGTEMFKRLSEAYQILTDSERRAIYDVSGHLPNGEHEGDMYNKLDQDNIEEVMSDFFDTYRNSDEEREDIKSSYEKAQGSFARLIHQHLIFRNDEGEVERLLGIIQGMIDTKEIMETNLWGKSTYPEAIAKINKKMKKEREEADKEVEKFEAERRKKHRAESKLSDLKALIVAKKEKDKKAFERQMDALEARYVSKGGKRFRK
eukprot:Tbor_TRINITY_DN5555_c4_g3::TRINITY_DN5555_c4_g3_i1::g.13296::m.13296/K09529/DNAJC9; DnaJ homolog subfamily C member 9